MVFLIAEDNARFRELIKRYLSKKIPDPHTIFEVGDGGEAVAVYEHVLPDWVLMDIAMEPMDGLVAARAIIAAHPDARIIMLTDFDEARYRAAAAEIGARAFILKEHLSDIIRTITADLDNRTH